MVVDKTEQLTHSPEAEAVKDNYMLHSGDRTKTKTPLKPLILGSEGTARATQNQGFFGFCLVPRLHRTIG